MSEFDDIRDHEGWRRKLRELLQEAEQAASASDVQPRFRLAERLTQFIERSFPNDEVVRALDQIAGKAAVGLLEQTIDERLRSIVARSAELAALAKSFEAAAGEAGAAAAQLRLERVGKALDAMNGSIAALRELEATLRQGIDDPVATGIGGTLEALARLRELLERR